jgi:hypothetical protein
MSSHYTHLLIAENANFAPQPAQIAAFLDGLVTINSTPLNATIKIARLSGKFRTVSDSVEGEELSIPLRDFKKLGSISDIPEQLVGLDDYGVMMSGQGPAEVPPFTLYTLTQSKETEFKETYSYDLSCHLRAKAVSTCEEPPFGSLRPGERAIGIFRHPRTGATIDVPRAGCARFWIQFQFGKWLLPKIEGKLNLIDPSILANATGSFEVGFAQGCICV